MTNWLEDLRFSNSQHGVRFRDKHPDSPYYEEPEANWPKITRELLSRQKLTGPALATAVLGSWDDIFSSQIGPARIGVDIFPAPQVMGFLLHELTPLRVALDLPGWRRDATASERDLVFDPDPSLSIEIKTSSNPTQVFGNRSFGQENAGRGKKAKSGYYCTINFEGWKDAPGRRPEILRIRYGWIDSTDWVAQEAATGQASSLPGRVYRGQLALIYERT